MFKEDRVEQQQLLLNYLKARNNVIADGKSSYKKMIYVMLHDQIQPVITSLANTYSRRMAATERDFFKTNNRLPVQCLNKMLEERRQVCEHYLISVVRRNN
jgi:hypothetical protein